MRTTLTRILPKSGMGQLVLVGWYLCQSWIVPMRNARGAPPIFSGHTVSTSSSQSYLPNHLTVLGPESCLMACFAGLRILQVEILCYSWKNCLCFSYPQSQGISCRSSFRPYWTKGCRLVQHVSNGCLSVYTPWQWEELLSAEPTHFPHVATVIPNHWHIFWQVELVLTENNYTLAMWPFKFKAVYRWGAKRREKVRELTK